MKNKLSVNGFEVNNSFITVTVIGFSAAAMHLSFLFFFLSFKVMALMYVNIFSVAFYIACGVISFFVDTTRHPIRWITPIFTEITLHAVLCTMALGVDTCFILYPLISLPVCAYYLFFYTEKKIFRRAIVIFVAVTFAATAVSVGVTEYRGGSVPLGFPAGVTIKEKMILRTVNIIYSTIMLYSFTLSFYLKMTDMMSRLRQSADDLQYTATHDALTGLINRRCFWEQLDELGRKKAHYDVVMGDLDGFKGINDTYGHGCGDLVLKSVADIINERMKSGEIACRWGGEEVVIVFLDEGENALKRLEEIRSTIEALELEYEGTRVHVTMTFGFADSEEIEKAAAESNIDEEHSTSVRLSVESLITLADKRLYIGKRNGKNVVVSK